MKNQPHHPSLARNSLKLFLTAAFSLSLCVPVSGQSGNGTPEPTPTPRNNVIPTPPASRPVALVPGQSPSPTPRSAAEALEEIEERRTTLVPRTQAREVTVEIEETEETIRVPTRIRRETTFAPPPPAPRSTQEESRVGSIVLPTARPTTQTRTVLTSPGAIIPAPEPTTRPIARGSAAAIIFTEDQPGIAPEVTEGEVVEEGPVFDPGQLLREGRLSELTDFALAERNPDFANAMGWAYFERDDYTNAVRWFEQALRWDENQNEAALGLALSLFRINRLDDAEAIALWRRDINPELNNLLGDINIQRAIVAFREERYRDSFTRIREASRFRSLNREERLLEAWTVYHQGRESQSATMFENLYRIEMDDFAASGLYSSLMVLQDTRRIRRLALELGGPLEELFMQEEGENFLERKLYRSAWYFAPRVYPELEGIDANNLFFNAEFVSRKGSSGIDQLSAFRGALGGTVFNEAINRFDIEIGLVSLNAGSLPENAFVGLVPQNPLGSGYRERPKTKYNGMIDAFFRYEREGNFTPFLEIGLSPLGGEINSTLLGELGVRRTYNSGAFQVNLYRDSVRESLLSYTGMRDPWELLQWGRVTETGIRLELFQNIFPEINYFGTFTGAFLRGYNVADNEKIAFSSSIIRTFRPDGWDYINIGPAFLYQTFNRNLEFYTFGHGGYFSPEFMLQGTINFQFMTQELDWWLIRGQVLFGAQTNRKDSAPVFPLAQDLRIYAENEQTSAVVNLQVQGAMMLTDHWMGGLTFVYNKAPAFDEFRVGLFMTIFFEPRRNLVEDDLPRFFF
jgi:tetratricopeptide (TPR) repeat protein